MIQDFDIAEDQTGPHIKQLSFFLPNRLGALQRATRQFESHNVHIGAISILDAADHAVVRVVVDRPAVAKEALVSEGYSVFEAELLGVEVPSGFGIRKILSALLLAEVNIHYVYSLMVRTQSHAVVALHVDDLRAGGRVLKNHGLTLVGQDELEWPDGS